MRFSRANLTTDPWMEIRRLSAGGQVLPRALVEVHFLRHLAGCGTIYRDYRGLWTVLWYPLLWCIWVISCI